VTTYGFIDVLVEETEGCPGCAMRWKAESPVRVVASVRYAPETGDPVVCRVSGWSADGPGPATAVTVEDSGGGTAVLVWGGDHGLRLHPQDGEGRSPFAEPYLLLGPEDVDPPGLSPAS
jgi:hypothetical protein